MNSQLSRSNKPIEFNKKPKRLRKRRYGIAQILRGILLEGFGALALVSLYVMVNSPSDQFSASAATNGLRRQAEQQPTHQQTPVGHPSAGWSSLHRQSSGDVNRPVSIGPTHWSTWGQNN